MARPVRHTRYDYKSGTTTKDWLVQSRADAVDAQYTSLSELPTSDPHINNVIWNNSGTPTKSTG